MIGIEFQYRVTHTPSGCNWETTAVHDTWSKALRAASELPLMCRPKISRVKLLVLDEITTRDLALMDTDVEPPFDLEAVK